jgi:hypothetical protein
MVKRRQANIIIMISFYIFSKILLFVKCMEILPSSFFLPETLYNALFYGH